MALAPHVGTSSSPNLVLHRTRTRIPSQGLGHRPAPLTRLSPLGPRIPLPSQEPTHLPVGPHTLAIMIAILESLRRGTMLVGAASSVCLGASCTPSLVGTRTLVRRLPAPPLGPTPCLGAGNPTPAPAPNREIDCLMREVNLPNQTITRTQIPDQRAHNRPTNVQALRVRLVQITTRVQIIGIAAEVRLVSGPRVTSVATDKVAPTAIARGIETGIEMVKVRGGTPTVGIIQNSINHCCHRREVTSSRFSYLIVLLSTSRAPSLPTFSLLPVGTTTN